MKRLDLQTLKLLEQLKSLRDDGILDAEEYQAQVDKLLHRDNIHSRAGSTPLSGMETVDSVQLEPALISREPLIEFETTVSPQDLTTAANIEHSEFGFDQSGAHRKKANRLSETDPPRRKGTLLVSIGLAVILVSLGLLSTSIRLGATRKYTTSGGTSQPANATSTPFTAPTTTSAGPSTTIPEVTTTTEVLECPYSRTVEAVDNSIVTPEGITITVLPQVYQTTRTDGGYTIFIAEYIPYKFGDFEITNTTNFRLRIGIEASVQWLGGSFQYSWEPDNGRAWVNGYQTEVARSPSFGAISNQPIENAKIEIVRATIDYRCP